jgi:branched-subunit amino acid transport protein AzlD
LPGGNRYAADSVQTLILILAVALGAMVTRFTPFLALSSAQRAAKVVSYLGSVLPPAMLGLLTVFCLRNVSIPADPHGIPELIAIAVIVVLHKGRKQRARQHRRRDAGLYVSRAGRVRLISPFT